MNPQKLLACAIDAARLAGKILKGGFGTDFSRQSKSGGHNLVTEYDISCEKTIVEFLSQAFPDSSFLAEEGGITKGSSELQWIIDPLDGTVNFAHGIPFFSVSIAAVVFGELVCGVIYQPITDELFTALKGEGAFLNGKPLRTSEVASLGKAILATGFPYNVADNPLGCIEHVTEILRRGLPLRRLGSAALDLAYTAAGRFDGYWEASLFPWDAAAGILMVREAGGRVSTYQGTEYSLGTGGIVATNGLIHNELIELLCSPQHQVSGIAS